MFSHGRLWIARLTVLTLLVVAGPAPAAVVHAQTPAPFAIPTAAELPTAAAAAVGDSPVALPDPIDLAPVIETAAADFAALTAEQWEVAALARTLGDPVAAFELVRDGIAFDAYPGVLRGADGALAARAGNSFDRALLLKALLDAQGVTSRFAFGRLSPDAAAAVMAHVLDAPSAALPSPAFSPFDAAFEGAVSTRARRDYALLSDAIGDRVADLDADATAAALTDLASHAWVEVAQPDGTWMELDPSLPGGEPGLALTTVDTTADVMPDDVRHTITLRVIAETLEDGYLDESTLLEVPLDAATAARQQVLLAFLPGSVGGSLLDGGPGGLLGGGGQGGDAFAPMLIIDGAAWQGEPVSIVGESGGGGLLGGGGGQVDLTSLSLEVQVDVPGAEPEVLRHVIADRVPPTDRASDSVTPDALLEVQDADGAPAIFANVLHVMLSTGGANPRAYAERQLYAAETAAWGANASDADVDAAGVDEAMAPLAIADEVLVMTSEQRLLPALNDQSTRAFVARPRIYLSSRGVDPVDPTLDVVATDLLTDSIRVVPRAGAGVTELARHQLWYGVLQGAVESEYALRNAAALEPATTTLTGVSFDMAQPLSVLTAADGTLPEAADSTLGDALAAGGLAVIPGDTSSATTWWQLAADGTTRSIVAPRLGAGIGSGVPPSLPKRVEPALPSKSSHNQQGGKGKDPGKEYTEMLGIQKKVAPNVGKAAQIARDTFDKGADAALQLARKKALGG